MILLRFTFRNHRSFRDEAVFDLTRPSLKTLKLPEGTRWADHVHHVDGVYGANASGKSNLLDALSYALRAIESSASTWLGAPGFPRAPFALDPARLGDPSEYELEFVSRGRRYDYRFSADAEGICDESLKVLGKQRWTTLLKRTQDGKVSRVSGLTRVARRELALSRAAEMDHEVLAPIRRDLVEGFDAYRAGDHASNRSPNCSSRADSNSMSSSPSPGSPIRASPASASRSAKSPKNSANSSAGSCSGTNRPPRI